MSSQNKSWLSSIFDEINWVLSYTTKRIWFFSWKLNLTWKLFIGQCMKTSYHTAEEEKKWKETHSTQYMMITGKVQTHNIQKTRHKRTKHKYSILIITTMNTSQYVRVYGRFRTWSSYVTALSCIVLKNCVRLMTEHTCLVLLMQNSKFATSILNFTDTFDGHICMTHLVDTFVWHICTTHLYDTFVWHICMTHLMDTLVWNVKVK